MYLLAIDTATIEMSVALRGPEGIVGEKYSAEPRRHAEDLMDLVVQLCVECGVLISDIDAVGVTVGPGLFTGLRVGVAAANIFAQARNIPVFGVDALQARVGSYLDSENTVVVVADARRGEVFVSAYTPIAPTVEDDDILVENNDVWFPKFSAKQILEPQAMTPQSLVTWLGMQDDTCVLVGDGAPLYRENFVELTNISFAEEAYYYPQAKHVAEFAYHQLQKAVGDTVEQRTFSQPLQPVYLRLPDAEIGWKTRANSTTAA